MLRPKLFQVVAADDYKVKLYYDNGKIKLYDCRWILSQKGVFDKIKSVDNFKNLCTIMNGTLAWDISGCRDPYNCIDICPDTVYDESKEIKNENLKAA